MISQPHIQLMARYNRWQNESLYGAAEKLPDSERRRERGAFFGSIHGTLNHILWADQLWLQRFAGTPAPAATSIKASPSMIDGWDDLKRQRITFDQTITKWAESVDPAWLASDLTWFSATMNREITKPAWLLVTHMFNHQTHHRGQVHCMLTQSGIKPDVTDIPVMAG